MAEFKAIETQEELNHVIGERIARAKESALAEATEKYKDYEDLKSQNASLTSRLDEMTERIKSFDELTTENDALKKRCNDYQLSDWRTKAAIKHNIPLSMANRIQGDSEESIFADAETLAPMVSRMAPPKSAEPIIEVSDTENALRQLSKSLKGE